MPPKIRFLNASHIIAFRSADQQRLSTVLRYGIVPFTTAGTASQNSLTGEERAFQEAIPTDCNHSVFGTSWRKAAAAGKKRRDSHSIEFNQCQGNLHGHPFEKRNSLLSCHRPLLTLNHIVSTSSHIRLSAFYTNPSWCYARQ